MPSLNTSDGNSYKLLPIKEDSKTGKSSLEDIPRIKLNITTQEIVELLRECRAGETVSPKSPPHNFTTFAQTIGAKKRNLC